MYLSWFPNHWVLTFNTMPLIDMLAYRSTRQVLSIPSVLVLICMTNFTILFQKCKLVNQHSREITTKQKSMTSCTMNTVVYRHVHDIMEWQHWQQMWSWPWLQVWLPFWHLPAVEPYINLSHLFTVIIHSFPYPYLLPMTFYCSFGTPSI